jgi:hypothetical protein
MTMAQLFTSRYRSKRYSFGYLAIRVARRLEKYDVIEALADVMLFRGIPEDIRLDNDSEFVAKELWRV